MYMYTLYIFLMHIYVDLEALVCHVATSKQMEYV